MLGENKNSEKVSEILFNFFAENFPEIEKSSLLIEAVEK